MINNIKMMKIYVLLTLLAFAAALTLSGRENLIVGSFVKIDVSRLTPEEARVDAFIQSKIGGGVL